MNKCHIILFKYTRANQKLSVYSNLVIDADESNHLLPVSWTDFVAF